MISAKDIFVKCDELDGLPEPNKENYLFEETLLQDALPRDGRILQVGSMDGVRSARLLRIRPDLHLTGLEIEEALVVLARKNVASAGFRVEFIHGDITSPPRLERFDCVVCLNHTLGYIPDHAKALAEMRKLGERVIVSVYGEKFNDELARAYFAALGVGDDFPEIKRYTRAQVDAWGGKVTETPIGYFCVLG